MSVIANNIVAGAAGQGGADAAYEISRSVRFNSSDSAYLSRNLASTGDQQATVSLWVKRSKLGVEQCLIDTNRNYQTAIKFNSSDQLFLLTGNGAGVGSFTWTTAQVFRDCSSWYHIVAAWDTTQATATNRLKIYVNGAEVTAFGTQQTITQNMALGFSGASAEIGNSIQNNYLDGYLADVHFIDGQALDPTSFGEFDTNGIWQPIEYTGTYGTNGFHLDFSDNSTAAALGTDTSGNSNTWTNNNLSVASGAGNDSLVDVPTNGTETDTGVGGEVRGNYCTFNPINVVAGTGTVSNGNLDVTHTGTSPKGGRKPGTLGVSSGKWYWEVAITSSGDAMVGIMSVSNSVTGNFVGGQSNEYGYYGPNGNKYTNNSSTAYGATYTNGNIIGVALDLDAGTITFYKDGVSQGQAFSSISGTFTPAVSAGGGSGASMTANFGQRPFAYTAPSGYKALCTTNLPDPTIADGSTAFDAVAYSGNGGTQSITGVNFSPDFLWFKRRQSPARLHMLYDTVRGASGNKVLNSDTTNAEGWDTATYGQLDSADSNGFTVTTGSNTDDNINSNNDSYIAWLWDAGSSTVTNTDGSITSNVRANPSAGFSIVSTPSIDSTNTIRTAGHGLNATPEFIISKNRDFSDNWFVYHKDIQTDNKQRIYLNSTAAVSSSTAVIWAHTSNVIGFNGAQYVAVGNSDNLIFYCFAPVDGYSSFGSYTGNGSSDGPFVYTGFRPRWIMIKSSTNAGAGNTGWDWHIFDSERDTFNPMNKFLDPNTNQSEQTRSDSAYFADMYVDFVSNGFKLRNAYSSPNHPGSTFIYAAFAEHPFKTARAR